MSLQASVCPHGEGVGLVPVCLVPGLALGGGAVPGLVLGGVPGLVRGVYLADTLLWDQVHPPRTRCTPGTKYTPRDQVHLPGTRYSPPGTGTPTPPRTRYTPRTRYPSSGPGTPPSGPGTLPPNTDNERPVRILLECILVCIQIEIANIEQSIASKRRSRFLCQ